MSKQNYPFWLKAITFLILLPVAWFTYTAVTDDMDLTYVLTDEAVQISHRGTLFLIPAEERLIPFSEIVQVQLLQRVPKLDKIFGKDGFKTMVGDFKTQEYGRVKAYVLNSKWPAVVITTKSNIYIITPTNAAEFVKQVEAQLGS